MKEIDKDFIVSCKRLGGKLITQDKRVICDFGNGQLGLVVDLNNNDFNVVDKRVKPGINIATLVPVEHIASDDSDIVASSGQSFIRVGPEKNNIKVYTEIEGASVYGYDPETVKELRFSQFEKEGCPIGTQVKNGECIPDVKLKPQVPSSKVPLPKYSSLDWNKSVDVPWILIDDSYSIAKATIGTWINSAHATISKEFLSCKKPVEIKLEVGKEYRDAAKTGAVDKSFKIGGSYYDRDKLYRIGEEIFGVKIMDTVNDKPLRSEVDKKRHLQMNGLVSGASDSPLVIRGVNKIYYLLNPMEEY